MWTAIFPQGLIPSYSSKKQDCISRVQGEKMKTLRDAIAAHSPESQARIKEMANEMISEAGLQLMREKLQPFQKTR